MLIQDMNHIEVAQSEVVGGNAAAKRIAFITSNAYNANITGTVKFDADIATAGAAADAVGGPGYIAFNKADSSTFTAPGVGSAISTSASSLRRIH
jgi:hypothetical protein